MSATKIDLPADIASAAKDLADATGDLETATNRVEDARRTQTTAVNRVNRAQKAMDEMIVALRKSAPSNSDWYSQVRSATKQQE